MDLLSEVEDRLRDVLAGYAGATHLIEAGGKRLRPLLVTLGAEFGPRRDGVVAAAVLTELIHVGTLHHDDVMDQAPTRHGVPTANVLWGNNRAVLLGDLMLARAAELGAELGLPALRLQTSTLARLVRGQLMETVRPETADPMAFCLEVMADKSASLFAMAAELGALVAGADPGARAALRAYGEHLGMAFQLVDDVLDIVGARSGKTPGTDLRAGVVTVPVLHALAAGDRATGRPRGCACCWSRARSPTRTCTRRRWRCCVRVRVRPGPARTPVRTRSGREPRWRTCPAARRGRSWRRCATRCPRARSERRV